jgi:hypothetical protein
MPLLVRLMALLARRLHRACGRSRMSRMSDSVPAPLPVYGRTTPQGPPTVAPAGWDPSHITFGDVLSALNPLQYVPVVGMIYREVTGDQGHPALRVAVAGVATVFFGPVGLAMAMIGAAGSEVLDDRLAAGVKGGCSEASLAYRRAARVA